MDILTGRINNTYKLPLGLTLGINAVYSHRSSKGGNGDGNYFGSIWPAVMRADPMIPAWDEYNDNWGEILFSYRLTILHVPFIWDQTNTATP